MTNELSWSYCSRNGEQGVWKKIEHLLFQLRLKRTANVSSPLQLSCDSRSALHNPANPACDFRERFPKPLTISRYQSKESTPLSNPMSLGLFANPDAKAFSSPHPFCLSVGY